MSDNLVNMYGFDGFYYSRFDPSVYMDETSIMDDFDCVFDDEMVKENNISENTLKEMRKEFSENTWDYFENKEYEQDVSKKWLEGFNESINNIDGLEKVEFEFVRLDSPLAYNYSTDKIVAKVKHFGVKEKQTVVKLMEKFKDELRPLIQESWSCRSGFISFISNNYEFWIDLFKGKKYTKEELKEHSFTIYTYVPIILYYLGYLENYGTKGEYDFNDYLANYAMEDNYFSSYFNYTPLTEKFVTRVKD